MKKLAVCLGETDNMRKGVQGIIPCIAILPYLWFFLGIYERGLVKVIIRLWLVSEHHRITADFLECCMKLQNVVQIEKTSKSDRKPPYITLMESLLC